MRPGRFGDPGSFCSRLWPELVANDKDYDLGIVVHLSELVEQTPTATTKPELDRYAVPEQLAGSVRIINPITERSVDGVRRVVEVISRCRRILSTSLHGLVVAEAVGVPAFFYCFNGAEGATELVIAETGRLDHRVRDLYSVLNRRTVPSYVQPRNKSPDWDALLAGPPAKARSSASTRSSCSTRCRSRRPSR